MISNLPVELQNKIFFYAAEHPCAKIIKQQRDYIFNKSISAKRCVDDYGCLYHIFYWYDSKILMRTQKNIRWMHLLEELGGIINLHTNNGLEPIEFDKLLKYTTRLKINDVEKKWLRHHFRNSKQVLV
jgi:hypothetical protein